jgi:hypothetical protein
VSHTPGPWKIEPMDNTDDDEMASGFADLIGPEPAYDGWVPPVEWRFRKEDARLIAAAPELYDALKRINDHITSFADRPLDMECIVRVRAAIAKATEQSHPAPTAAPPLSADEQSTTSIAPQRNRTGA